MSKRVVFYNYNLEEIRKLLSNIGKVRFEKATGHITHIEKYKVSKFRIIYRHRTCSLQYNESYKQYISIMLLDDYEMPKTGWIMELDGW